MMHLLFLLGGFAATFLLQMALLLRLSFQTTWKDKRSVALVALSLPGLTLLLFSLLMVPDILMVHGSLQYHWEQSLLWAGVVLPVLLCGLAFVWGLLRLLWLVIRVQRCTWPAPVHLSGGDYPAHVSVRLWYHTCPFAFTLPALWPGSSALVILSTALVECLDPEEVQAVLWHETGHVCRRDFWSTWLATWWRDAFFYLPSSWKLLEMMREGQERRCDAWVSTIGGKRVTLALTSALLKIWEHLLQTEGKSEWLAQKAPGLVSEKQESLTEQRVQWLLEQIQRPGCATPEEQSVVQWGIVGTLVGLVLSWLAVLAILHFYLLSLGCALS